MPNSLLLYNLKILKNKYILTQHTKFNLVPWMAKTLDTMKHKLYKLVVNYHALNNSIKQAGVTTNVDPALSGELLKITIHSIEQHNIETKNSHSPLHLHFGRYGNN